MTRTKTTEVIGPYLRDNDQEVESLGGMICNYQWFMPIGIYPQDASIPVTKQKLKQYKFRVTIEVEEI